MKNQRLTRTQDSIGGAKRTHAPYVFTATCECGAKLGKDFNDEYFMYPDLNGGFEKFGVWCEECNREEIVEVRVQLVLELCK